MREDSFASSTGADQFSETAVFSGSDSEIQGPATPPQELQDRLPNSAQSDSEPLLTSLELPSSDENQVIVTSCELQLDADEASTNGDPGEHVESVKPAEEVHKTDVHESGVEEEKAETLKSNVKPPVHQSASRSTSRADSLPVSIFTDKILDLFDLSL